MTTVLWFGSDPESNAAVLAELEDIICSTKISIDMCMYLETSDRLTDLIIASKARVREYCAI